MRFGEKMMYASTDDGVWRKQLGVLLDRINTCGEGCLVMGISMTFLM